MTELVASYYPHYVQVDTKHKPSPCPICEHEKKMDYKVVEYLGKPTESWKNEAYFFRVFPPQHYNDPNATTEPTTEFVIVSRVYNRGVSLAERLDHEIMMFPSYENGQVINMHEMRACRGDISVKEWLESLGFHFVGDFKP